MKFICSVGSIVALALVSSIANAATTSTKMDGFVKDFCAADATAKGLQEKVFTVSANLFKNKDVVFSCSDGNTYKMYRKEATDDLGHYLFGIEATKKVGDVYDCDGKADIGMKTIGINCYPVKDETPQHRK